MKPLPLFLFFFLITELTFGQKIDNPECCPYKCNFKTIEKLREKKSLINDKLIFDFLSAMDRSCSNNVEWSEASNETLFWLANSHTRNLVECLKVNKTKVDIELILKEFEQPVSDNIDLKDTYSKLQSLKNKDKIVEEILVSLRTAAKNLGLKL